MANVKLSKTANNHLSLVMAELEMEMKERPDALKIAFSKGISAETLPNQERKELSSFEFPTTVIAKGDEILLIKHLIIEKLKQKIDDEELDKYILSFIEHGLYIMSMEIEQLSNADNYLLYLLDKLNVS